MYFWRIAIRSVQIFCLINCFQNHIGEFLLCEGISMLPTINNKDVLIVDYISPKIRRFKKGDIIIAKNPVNPSVLICKRIIATDEDRIGIFPNDTYVPRNHIWIEGDNTYNSLDSRYFGFVPLGLVLGRVICKVYPFGSFKIF